MATEFRPRWCERCGEYIQARRDIPPLWSIGYVLFRLAAGGFRWQCTQCGAMLPETPEERKRRIALAVFLSLPFVAVVVLILALIVSELLGTGK